VIPSSTKSRGTTLTSLRFGSPMIGTTAVLGWRMRRLMIEYGPSYFCVAPVLLSPTTTAGR